MGNREQHGGVEGFWGVHTFYGLVSPEKYFVSHPEYFSLIDGKRTHDRSQLCLSNPDVLRIAIENIKAQIRREPQYLIYDVSQNDNLGKMWLFGCAVSGAVFRMTSIPVPKTNYLSKTSKVGERLHRICTSGIMP